MNYRAPLLRLLLLVTLLARLLLAKNFAEMKISERMKQLIDTGIEAPKLKLNTALPLEVQYLLNENDLEWQDLGGTMQRLVLWDQGYVVTSSNKTREIMVRCDLGMDDVVVSREEFQNLQNCPSTLCTDAMSSETALRGTVCADSEIEKVAKCAVLVSESEANAASVDVETSLIWAEEVTNADVPMPTAYRHSLKTFAITMQYPSTGGSCPHQLALVIPCATIQYMENSTEWCTPSKSGVVPGLLQDLVDRRQSQSSDRGSSGMIIAIWVVAGILTMLLCIIGFMFVRHILRRREQSSGNQELIEKSTLDHYALTPGGGFFVGPHDSNDATDSIASELSDFETDLEVDICKRFSNMSGRSEVDYSDALSASKVLLLFQNDPFVHALRVPIIDVNGDKMISRGRDGSPNEVLVGTLGPREVILKRLRASKRNDTLAVERLAREIRMAAMLQHPNIVNILGIAWNSFQNLTAIWEYHRSGDLQRALRSGRKAQHWTWTRQKLQVAMGVLRGLSFLHSHSPPIIHGAIEPRHILLNSATGEPALCGLGHCAGRVPTAIKSRKAGDDSIWSSPEVQAERIFSEKSDIYSFGVVLVSLDTGKLLVDVPRDDLLDVLTPVCPEFIRKIAHKCLQGDPAARPTSRELLQHLEDISGTSSPWPSSEYPKYAKSRLDYDEQDAPPQIYL
ncbi:serine/threonine protein kinase [Phytophthora nicotianae CJ01A1]|uniref:Serine/threonine protein kinase n=5 Tax=Phytophthora nicotianae TaxID=4792 RepID=V9FF19_PHYNI|nr:serine/threonine protein kinase [Phytophthora nicotianae P1569]ETK89955.1 serine/threonine protein kinase [Phytophthora nicotianae]ETP19826.1 serine/threonine protein kinase [Phytophthora nicotianae CJ01A1]ETP47738.1 serine/threonine protein kinase [Phytophthora nicotianae P10297]ETL43353.1 serine/threonine protein kinase [Phytophthora nicotianae]